MAELFPGLIDRSGLGAMPHHRRANRAGQRYPARDKGVKRNSPLTPDRRAGVKSKAKTRLR